MMNRQTLLVLPLVTLSALTLSACGEAGSADTEPTPENIEMEVATFEPEDTSAGPEAVSGPMACNAALAESFIDRTIDFEVRSELLAAVAPLVNVRWLSPEERAAASAEEAADPERLTVELDEDDTVTDIYCG
jgi:hypothetical protein